MGRHTKRNETKKRMATLLNTGGIAILATSILNPAGAIDADRHGRVAYPIAGVIGAGLHLLARRSLGKLEDLITLRPGDEMRWKIVAT